MKLKSNILKLTTLLALTGVFMPRSSHALMYLTTRAINWAENADSLGEKIVAGTMVGLGVSSSFLSGMLLGFAGPTTLGLVLLPITILDEKLPSGALVQIDSKFLQSNGYTKDEIEIIEKAQTQLNDELLKTERVLILEKGDTALKVQQELLKIAPQLPSLYLEFIVDNLGL